LRATGSEVETSQRRPPGVGLDGDAFVTPWVEANRALFQRAIERGEIEPNSHLDTLAQIMPSMGAYRALIQRRAFDRAFLIEMIVGLLLPALGLGRRRGLERS
jgi:hypothetical protein